MYFKRKYSLKSENLDRQFKELPEEIREHSIRVGVSSETMASYAIDDLCEIYKVDKSENDLRLKLLSYIYDGGVYHDIGKLMIDEDDKTISNSLKRSLIELHPLISERILSLDTNSYTNTIQKQIVLSMAKYHHESYSGTGYPCRLKGDVIPLAAQICAIANLYDVLVEKRFENEEYAFDAARKTIEENRRMNFSEKSIECFVKAADEIKQLYTDRQSFKKSQSEQPNTTFTRIASSNNVFTTINENKQNFIPDIKSEQTELTELSDKVAEYEHEKKQYEQRIDMLNKQILNELAIKKKEIDDLISKVQSI